MFEGIRSPAVHMPKTMGELASTTSRFPHAVFWAGGTYIMSRHDYYPTKKSNDIIWLGDIPDLRRINRTDRYLESGAMVSARELLEVGKQVLPPILNQTLLSMATRILRNRITLGGALCTPDLRLALSCALSALQAEVEVRSFEGQRTLSQWIPVGRLYERSGKLALKQNELVSRIRILLDHEAFSTMKSAGSPITTPKEAVVLALACSSNQSIITNLNVCVALPTGGFFAPQDVNQIVRGMTIPLATPLINKITRVLLEPLETADTQIQPIQRERIRRFLETAIHDLNTYGLTQQ